MAPLRVCDFSMGTAKLPEQLLHTDSKCHEKGTNLKREVVWICCSYVEKGNAIKSSSKVSETAVPGGSWGLLLVEGSAVLGGKGLCRFQHHHVTR